MKLRAFFFDDLGVTARGIVFGLLLLIAAAVWVAWSLADDAWLMKCAQHRPLADCIDDLAKLRAGR